MQGEAAAYAHLGTFVRRAPAAQQAAFWKKVGQTISQTLAARGDAPTWVSTDRPWLGLGFGSSLVRPNQPHPHLTPTLAALTPPLALTPPRPHPSPGEHGGVRGLVGTREARCGAKVLPPLALPPLRRACSGAEEGAEGGIGRGGAAEAARQRASRLSVRGSDEREMGRR